MRGLVSSLVLILAFSRKVVIGAPKNAISTVSDAAAVNALEGASISSSLNNGCKIHGTCSVLNKAICCGVCILINSAIVSRDAHHLIIS